MDEFAWTAFKTGLDTRTLSPIAFAEALAGYKVMTNDQHKYVISEFDKHSGTIYGILIGNEVWKLNKR